MTADLIQNAVNLIMSGPCDVDEMFVAQDRYASFRKDIKEFPNVDRIVGAARVCSMV